MAKTRSGGYATGRARREQIIQAAAELFARVGYRAATVVDIAAEAGISRTGLLHHFASKEALLAAVLDRRDVEDGERFRAAIERGDALEHLRSLVAQMRHNTTVPQLVSLFAQLSAEATDPGHPAHDHVVARYEALAAELAVALRRAREAGQLRPGVDPDREARALIALMDGLQVQWLLAPDRVDMAAELRAKIEQALTVPLDAPADEPPAAAGAAQQTGARQTSAQQTGAAQQTSTWQAS